MVQSHFSLSWDSYKSNLSTGFSGLQQNGELVDMTLAADGHFVKVHQVLIALSSSYLKQLILSAPCQHPVIFLNNVSNTTLTFLLEYIYTGQVSVPSSNLSAFIEAAKALHIKGLENVEDNSKEKQTPINVDECNISSNRIAVKRKSSAPDQFHLPATARKVLVKYGGATSTVIVEKKNLNESMDTDEVHNTMDHTALEADTHLTDETQKDKDKGAVQMASSNLQYTVSIRGSLQVILNRYIYNLHSSQSTGVRRWRCCDYRNKKCSAFVVTQDNVVLNRANPHNHSFHDKKILDKIEKNAIYTAIDDVKGVIDKEKPKDNLPMESEFVGLSFNTELDDLTNDPKTVSSYKVN
ncbi:hypothetical protein KGM_205805 [Danaus plexippus plexippus]|uniref:BTB domain-containing protein n=1 Tax=Danaus plexippus plexippus TaxID=278856 RepID=A0A212EHW9_DANPL|nr:hypothetical protein KGM_205805 [Danaus plexippus plexippus]